MPRTTEPHPSEPRRGPVSIAAGAVEVMFAWSGDRWTHRILLDGEAAWDSVEGPWPATEDPRWPASPVLVELDRVGRGPNAAIVAVGLAGRSHFSASVSCVPGDGGSPELLFELACRTHEPPGWIGSTYRLAADLRAATAAGQAVAIRPIDSCCLLRGDGTPCGKEAWTASSERGPLRRQRAEVGPGAARPGPATIAWSYRVGPGGGGT